MLVSVEARRSIRRNCRRTQIQMAHRTTAPKPSKEGAHSAAGTSHAPHAARAAPLDDSWRARTGAARAPAASLSTRQIQLSGAASAPDPRRRRRSPPPPPPPPPVTRAVQNQWGGGDTPGALARAAGALRGATHRPKSTRTPKISRSRAPLRMRRTWRTVGAVTVGRSDDRGGRWRACWAGERRGGWGAAAGWNGREARGLQK